MAYGAEHETVTRAICVLIRDLGLKDKLVLLAYLTREITENLEHETELSAEET